MPKVVAGTVHSSVADILPPGLPPNDRAVVLPPVRLDPISSSAAPKLATVVQELPFHVSAVAVVVVGGAGSPVEPPAMIAAVVVPERAAEILPKLRVPLT